MIASQTFLKTIQEKQVHFLNKYRLDNKLFKGTCPFYAPTLQKYLTLRRCVSLRLLIRFVWISSVTWKSSNTRAFHKRVANSRRQKKYCFKKTKSTHETYLFRRPFRVYNFWALRIEMDEPVDLTIIPKSFDSKTVLHSYANKILETGSRAGLALRKILGKQRAQKRGQTRFGDVKCTLFPWLNQITRLRIWDTHHSNKSYGKLSKFAWNVFQRGVTTIKICFDNKLEHMKVGAT